jgi:phosphate:Na+ symporter
MLIGMGIVSNVCKLAGGLCLFLYGMKAMSDGVQQAAGDRMQRALNFMTRNRFIGVATGVVVTALVQSSSAVSVMLVSFVNAGLLTLTQAIGVIMGANIGTTTTAWIVSLIGFSIDISSLALPAIALGFVMGVIKWKHQVLGAAFIGFGFIFLGLQFLNDSLPRIDSDSLIFMERLSHLGFLSALIGVGVGAAVTLLMHSSAAAITMDITLAYGGIINFEIASAIILGANIGTTIDAILAAIGTKTAAKQTALVHVLFNVVGSIIALIFFRPLLRLVDLLVPGPPQGVEIAAHLAMFHSVFNIMCTLLFLPVVSQFAALVSFLIKDKEGEQQTQPGTYHLEYQYSTHSAPELNIIRAEKEIQNMAGLASSMFAKVSETLAGFQGEGDKTALVEAMVEDLRTKEAYADDMRVELTRFFLECTREHLSRHSELKVYRLLRIISDLEDMTDDCFGVGLLLERSIQKDLLFKKKEMDALIPYVAQVEDFLAFVKEQMGRSSITDEQADFAKQLESAVDRSRDKLRKLGRKRIEAGEDVKTELLFIDVVRRIEKVGDYCYNIAGALQNS